MGQAKGVLTRYLSRSPVAKLAYFLLTNKTRDVLMTVLIDLMALRFSDAGVKESGLSGYWC